MKYTWMSFTKELLLIRDLQVREFVMKSLQKAPRYFWTASASDSYKTVRVEWCEGPGGLVKHTKAVVILAATMMKAYPGLYRYWDEILAAAILHDICKRGMQDEWDYVDRNHALYPRQKFYQFWPTAGQEKFERIMGMVETHNGRWTPFGYDWLTPRPPVEEDQERISPEEYLHMIDTMASRGILFHLQEAVEGQLDWVRLAG